MTSICAAEIKHRWPADSTLLMSLLVELDRRGVVKSSMYNHMDHGVERVWTKI